MTFASPGRRRRAAALPALGAAFFVAAPVAWIGGITARSGQELAPSGQPGLRAAPPASIAAPPASPGAGAGSGVAGAWVAAAAACVFAACGRLCRKSQETASAPAAEAPRLEQAAWQFAAPATSAPTSAFVTGDLPASHTRQESPIAMFGGYKKYRARGKWPKWKELLLNGEGRRYELGVPGASCMLTGEKPHNGFKRTFGGLEIPKTWKPWVMWRELWWIEEKKWVNIYCSDRAMKLVDRFGLQEMARQAGLDLYAWTKPEYLPNSKQPLALKVGFTPQALRDRKYWKYYEPFLNKGKPLVEACGMVKNRPPNIGDVKKKLAPFYKYAHDPQPKCQWFENPGMPEAEWQEKSKELFEGRKEELEALMEEKKSMREAKADVQLDESKLLPSDAGDLKED